MHRLTFGGGALETLRQGLAVLGNHVSARLMIFPASFFHFPTRRIRIYSFDRNRVKLSSGCRIFLAVIVVRVSGIGRSPGRRLFSPCDLHATPWSRFPHVCSALKCV